MFFLIRFTYTALLLIFIQLLIPTFSPGGRFLILLIAIAVSFVTICFRKITAGRVGKNLQALLSGTNIIITLFFFGYYIPGVKLNFLGILATYMGVFFLELLLPNEWYELVYRKLPKKN
ncbi:MAG: hypothetical protein GXY86_17665 [Firmicutes bacterium]|nr:hypothetical protein [Bacillota bacterium]